MTRGELISVQVMSLLEKEVDREMVEVYSLAMPTEVWMGADCLVAPVFVLEEKQCWFLPALKQKDVVLHTASVETCGTPSQKMLWILKSYRTWRRDGTSMWKRDRVRITKELGTTSRSGGSWS